MFVNKIKRKELEMEARLHLTAHKVREMALQMFAEAEFLPGLARNDNFSHHDRDFSRIESNSHDAPSRNVNKKGGAQGWEAAANIKTSKFNRKKPWEVFIT